MRALVAIAVGLFLPPSPASELHAAVVDAATLATQDRPHVRYLTTYNLPEEDRADARDVVDFWLNSLSRRRTITRAQAITDASTDSPLTASGSLNTARYGSVLQPRGLVGVRGVSDDFDGNWYVKRVTHTLKKGSYVQDFSLTRGEIGALLPVVLP